ncbi:MAG: SRPBCC family protein [Bacteroidota bacterium]
MSIYTLETKQKIPANIEQVWDFISSPQNLKYITPEQMGFDIISKNLPEKMYPGMFISYYVKPILGIKLLWVSEITQLNELEYFVDEQRIGPYKLWHHLHRLTIIEGGVLMEDLINYKPPFGFLGSIANTIIIRKKLKGIFDYRKIKIEEKFGKF